MQRVRFACFRHRLRTASAAASAALLLHGCAARSAIPDPVTPVGAVPVAQTLPTGGEPVVVGLDRSGASTFMPATQAADRALAAELVALFTAAGGIHRAYLARVYLPDEPHPVLTVCIAAPQPVPDALVREIGRIYAGTHGTDGVLDVMDVDAGREAALRAGIEPFFATP